MTFLYITLQIVAAMAFIYLIGYIVAFCIMFFFFDGGEKEHLKSDLIYATASWLMVALAVCCWAFERDDNETEKDF